MSWRGGAGRGGGASPPAATPIADIPQPLLRIFLQAPLQQRPHLRRHAAQIRLLHDHRRQRVADVFALEQPLAREQFVQHHAEGPDVGALVAPALPRACSGAMYAAVPRIMPACVMPMVSVGEFSDCRWVAAPAFRFASPKVQHLHRAVGLDLDVAGLQIAMRDALVVRGFERIGDLARDAQSFIERHRPLRRLALDELHHQVIRARRRKAWQMLG